MHIATYYLHTQDVQVSESTKVTNSSYLVQGHKVKACNMHMLYTRKIRHPGSIISGQGKAYLYVYYTVYICSAL
jgi:hypothetical protein